MDRRATLRAAAACALGALPAAGCDGWHVAPDGGPARSGAATPSGPGTAPSGPSAPLPAELSHGPRDRRAVALTFHGQGDAALVRALLGELERGGAHATVLAVGTWLAEQPSMARRVLDGGHELGNHTQHHRDLARLDGPGVLAEITACAGQLRQLTGSIGTWFRPSQTRHATERIRAQARRAGYPTCLSYDVDSLDQTDPGPAAIARTVGAAVRNGSIVSLHCGRPGTVAAMPALLEQLRGRGLRAVTMRELMT
ncbi:Peptidoglycan/xylan/chitin deacetylase, PgdA/CDA1 family [Micromonospora pattaloongensis]|uniref:Peptidoglycan/xylan/chitin deacetylase, PgdA/CDA1 family n=1 Tax=Micromonospora pattaloongensis TaxID=405436 RepID=A0A1H3NWP8_9ACTN|nr:polysaccharide deacetylase family protein [Micromonospora pattaloongensis]SDY92945.1 Peptidoglycan/xylan/chitin deacetylase, PgdA/CDA1 family [Micromonospora pattaloongensis]